MNKHIQKYARWALHCILCLVPVALIGFGIVYWYLQRDPHALASSYLADISQKTGLEFSFNTVEVTLLPLPAISVIGLKVKGSGVDFSSAVLAVRPSFTDILHGDIMPGIIKLYRPRLYLTTKTHFADFSLLGEEIQKALSGIASAGDDKKILPRSCEFDIIQGQAIISGLDNSKIQLGNLETELDISDGKMLDGSAGFSYLRLFANDKQVVSLENTSFSGEVNLHSALNDAQNVKLNGKLAIGEWLRAANFNIDFDGSSSGWSSFASVDASLNLDGETVPASFSGRFISLANSIDIVIRSLQWSLDMDSGRVDASFRMPQQKIGWQLGGTLMAHRLSLTQWFGFARNLPPGLQMALDNIYSARLEFVLDAKGLQIPNIVATSTGAKFTGSGSVASFAKPVVFLDMKSEQANLGLAIPESLVKSPLPVSFPYGPLTPMPGTPLKPGETGIGYDIRLAAKKLIYGPLLINNASLRIYPGKMDKNGLEDVLLDGKGNFYGGTVNARCILGADPSMPININGTAKNVDGGAVSAHLRVLPFKKGKFTASANVFSKGKKLNVFMANLSGPIKVDGENVVLAAKGVPLFTRLDAQANLRGASEDNSGASFTGSWKTDASASDFSVNASLEGKLHFGKAGMTLHSNPAKFTTTVKKDMGPLPKNSKISGDCHLSGNSDTGKYTLSRLSAHLPGFRLGGEVTVDSGHSTFHGNIKAETDNLSKTARAYGATASIPSSLQKLKVDAAVKGGESEVRLEKMRGSIGASAFTGRLAFLKKSKPTFDFDLTVDGFDWEKQIGKESLSAATKNWDFKFLASFNAKGHLKIKNFQGWGTKFSAFSSPLNLENGRLSAGPASAVFCGATIQSRAHVDFNKGIVFNAVLAAHGFNLEEAAKQRKIQSVLTGKASMDAKINADLTGPGQIPGRLNGDWNFNVLSGSFQSRNNKGKLTGSPTKFSKLSASGKISNGIVESKNFSMQSTGLQVNGGGEVNLVSKKIDCNFNVNMKNLPDFPLYVYGPMDNPKTSIGAGKMVINAIGGITTGIANVFGGLVQGTLNIFR